MKKFYNLIIFLLAAGPIMGQQIPFQGRLLDGGKPYNGTATLVFTISAQSWTETKNNVSVTDGYYSVVLGETTPLPEQLFADSREATLSITVNGEALSPVTLHSPLIPFTGSTPLEIDTLKTFGLEVLGENDNPKVLAGATSNNGGYDGIIILKDSLNQTGLFMQTDRINGTGGYLQLNGRDYASGGLRSVALMATKIRGRDNSAMDLYGENFDATGLQLMLDAYVSDTDETGTLNPTGYRRGGIDIKNYYNLPTHNIFSFEDASNNITSAISLSGSAGAISPTSTVFISSGDIAGSGGLIDLSDESGTVTVDIDASGGGNIILNNRLNLLGDLNATGSGGVEVLNSGGTAVIILDGESGNITATGTVSSDRRLKKDIRPLENVLSKTLDLEGVSYHLKDPERSERKHIGVIAQDVEEIYPEFVYTDKNGMKAVNYAQMTAVLIEAIKELNVKIVSLEQENKDLKASLAEIKTLRSEMNQLMKLLGNGKAASK